MKVVTIRPNGTRRVTTINDGPSKTDPSFEPDCNVNNIMAKFAKTGEINHVAKKQGQYIDISMYGDFQEATNAVTKASQDFQSLPAIVRERFNQSPVELIEFLQNPANSAEAQKLGLIPVISTASSTLETDPSESAVSKNQKTNSKKTENNDDKTKKNDD